MERVLARLGGGWQLTAGAADAYGNSWMQFVELRSATHETAVSVWWAGSEVWIQAFLGVPYEASAELSAVRPRSSLASCMRFARVTSFVGTD